MAAGDARPIPKKNAAWRVTFPIFDNDGDLVTGAAGLDSEVSKDGGTFADCTNEATEIATSSGMYYLDMTDSEMNADTVAIIVKTSTSDAKTTPIVVYPVSGGIKEIYSDTTLIHSETTIIASDVIVIDAAVSNVHSETTAIQSDAAAVESELIVVHSETTAIQTDTGNIYSDTTIIASDVIVIDAAVSNVHSETTAIQSDAAAVESELIIIHSETTVIASDVIVIDAAVSNVHSETTAIQSDAAAVESELIVVHSETTAIQTDTGNIYSDTTIIASDVIVIDAATSNVHSETTAIQSDAAAVESELIIVHSETTAIQTDTGNIYSDTTIIYSDTTLIHSETTVIASDVIVIDAATSNVHSETTAIQSDAAAVESELIIVHSETTVIASDTVVIESDTTAIEAAGGALTAAQASDLVAIESELIVVHSETTVIASDTVVIESDTTAIEAGGGSLTPAQASDLAAIESELILTHSDTTVIEAVTAAAIANAVWDEVLTSATHNVGYSAGQRLRYLILSGATAQTATPNTITLSAAESTTDDIYTENIISIVAGTGAGQTRLIIEYVGSTRVATVDREWAITPDSSSVYELLPFAGILLAAHGVAQASTASTITLGTSALAVANSYVGCAIYIAASTGAGQTRLITAYTAGRVATVSPDWDTQPDNTSVYKVLPVGRTIVESLPAATQASIDAIEADTNELQTDWADGGRLDLLLDAAATAGAGAGAITFTYTLTSSVDGSPIADADVWVTTDQAGTNVIASGTTDANGDVTFYLDAGTVYVWRQKSGWNFTNPDTETVS